MEELSVALSTPSNGAPSGKPLRVLCLHGFRTSAASLQQQLFNKWDNSLLHDLLDLSLNFQDNFIPFWMHRFLVTANLMSMGSSHLLSTSGSSTTLSLQNILDWRNAFSTYPNTCLSMDLRWSARFLTGCCALCSSCWTTAKGAMFKNIKVKEDCYSDIIRCPSLHFIGSKDWLKPKNEEVREVFEEPVIVRRGAKHTVPRLDEAAIGVVRTFLTRVQACGEHHLEETDKAFEYRESKQQEEHHLEVADRSIEFRGAQHEGILREDCLLEIEVAA